MPCANKDLQTLLPMNPCSQQCHRKGMIPKLLPSSNPLPSSRLNWTWAGQSRPSGNQMNTTLPVLDNIGNETDTVEQTKSSSLSSFVTSVYRGSSPRRDNNTRRCDTGVCVWLRKLRARNFYGTGNASSSCLTIILRYPAGPVATTTYA